MKIPIPPCNNNRRTHIKCRRMCCKRKKTKPVSTTQQSLLLTDRIVVLDNRYNRTYQKKL